MSQSRRKKVYVNVSGETTTEFTNEVSGWLVVARYQLLHWQASQVILSQRSTDTSLIEPYRCHETNHWRLYEVNYRRFPPVCRLAAHTLNLNFNLNLFWQQTRSKVEIGCAGLRIKFAIPTVTSPAWRRDNRSVSVKALRHCRPL